MAFGHGAFLYGILAGSLGLQPVRALPLLDSLVNPYLDTLNTILSGKGLIEGTLGAVEGALGVEKTYDYVVVGGGTGGNAVGVRLAEAGFSVAIIEAGLYYEIEKPVLGSTPAGGIVGIGANPLDSDPLVDWVFMTEPQAGANDRKVHYARGKCLGGSSAINFMIHHRGSEGSYQQWADAVGDDSYTYQNLEPYFQKAVNFTPPNNEKRGANVTSQYDTSAFSEDGPVQVGYTNYVSPFSTWMEKALLALGLKKTSGFSSGKLLGTHYTQTMLRASDQTRSASDAYIKRALSNRNLAVYTSTVAQRLLFDANNTATGVEVQSTAITYNIHAAREVIVAAGAFQTPQLLMVSGIGPRETLEQHGIDVVAERPGVGQNMWDHVMFGPAYEVGAFNTLDHTLHNPVALADALTDYAVNADGVLSSNVVEFIGWEKLPHEFRQGFSPETTEALAQFPDDWPEVELISGNGYIGDFALPVLQQPLDGKQYATILGGMVAPTSRGNVTLKSASMNDAPAINPNWLTTPADQEMAVGLYRRLRQIWASDTMQEIVAGDGEYWPGLDKDSDDEILAVVRDSLMTIWHAACTCKMGREDDAMAVVDAEARVFGVQGLRIVDASAMPVLPPGHPSSTIYALAEKIADGIIKKEKSG